MPQPTGVQAVTLFTKNKVREVQSFILKVVNNNCADLRTRLDGPRLEGRANLTLVVLIVPIEDGKIRVDRAFTAVTKEFSTSGTAIVLEQPMGFDEVIVGFRWEQDVTFIRAEAKHLNPMGGGFFQLGLQMNEVVHIGDHPELKAVCF